MWDETTVQCYWYYFFKEVKTSYLCEPNSVGRDIAYYM